MSRIAGPTEQAQAMLAVLERDYPGRSQRLMQDALIELQRWSELTLELINDVAADDADGRSCSVAGTYRSDTTPPRVSVARSASHGRRQFTALHELGHHLQQTHLGLGNAVMEAQDFERFEDAACDAFAARILIPDQLVASTIRSRGATASDVVALFEASSASRAACCARAVETLPGLGAIVLYEPDGTVSFSTARGIYPPARGTNQAHTPLVKAALAEPSRSAPFTRTTTVTYRNGSLSEEFYGQAAWCDGYLVAIYALTNPPWEPFALPIERPYQPRFWTCETCEETFRVEAEGCATCGQPKCEQGHCNCTVRRERTCTACYLSKHHARFPPQGTVCLDCLS